MCLFKWEWKKNAACHNKSFYTDQPQHSNHLLNIVQVPRFCERVTLRHILIWLLFFPSSSDKRKHEVKREYTEIEGGDSMKVPIQPERRTLLANGNAHFSFPYKYLTGFRFFLSSSIFRFFKACFKPLITHHLMVETVQLLNNQAWSKHLTDLFSCVCLSI